MRVTVLGGSAASPNAGAGCAGFLVSAGATNLVLDLGPGTLQELRRHVDFRRLDGVVISHMHVDHCLDLFALRHALAYNPIPPPTPAPVWLPPGGSAIFAAISQQFDACDRPGTFDRWMTAREYDPARGLTIGACTLTFAPAVHDLPCWAIRADGHNGAALGYTADTGPAADLRGFFHGVDLLIAEATLPPGETPPDRSRGSLTAGEAAALARDTGAHALLLTHTWEEHDAAGHLREARAVFAGPVEVATPAMTVRLP